MKRVCLSICFLFSCIRVLAESDRLTVNEQGYFETRGFNVLVFSNPYSELFGDSKISGVELIHHGVRTATNGDVRLSPTPEQWDPVSHFDGRKIFGGEGRMEVHLSYPAWRFSYMIRAEARERGVLLSVHLDTPLPRELEGRAGFNLEFLPSAYFEKAYVMDGKGGMFPLSAGGPMENDTIAGVQPKPLARGRRLVLAPDDPARRVALESGNADLLLYDGRNKAQNGWYVVRSLIPSGKSGNVLQWFLSASTIPGWTRQPVIAHSQVGYLPGQKKMAIIELDVNDRPLGTARVWKVMDDGREAQQFSGATRVWGKYLRFNYVSFDFSALQEPGLYRIEYGKVRTRPFLIANDVYAGAWQPTLDVFFPVQMDHMAVREAYRVWHGAPHLDDALQAPVNHEHFDLYAQGPTTDSPYKPGEHIPGLNVGGWFDAGDYDIRTQTVYATVSSLVLTWEMFHPGRDETTIDQRTRRVEIHRPDGKPDLLQQIEHGTLALLAQFKSVGHAIPGIIEAHLWQYRHLGDASTVTDNRVYNPALDSLAVKDSTSGLFDDRWAFTSSSSALNYGAASALAAASRALRGYNDGLAEECLAVARRAWVDEQSHQPNIFRHGNTTGGVLDDEKLGAAVELLITTREPVYGQSIAEIWKRIDHRSPRYAFFAVRAMPFLDKEFGDSLKALAGLYKKQSDSLDLQNPFGVPLALGGWGGNGRILGSAATAFLLHKAFPSIIGPDYILKALGYVYGCHPGSDISFVSGVGTQSKKVAYGSNRADFSFIPGGVVPGILIVSPDLPENKEDWPFLWGENEYVVNAAASYLFAAHAANELAKEYGIGR
jgi:endoglucanase